MNLLVEIRLGGPPRGKGRPRTTVRNGFAQIYTDPKTAKYETQLRYAAAQEMAGRRPTALPVALSMTVGFAVPTAWSKKKCAAALLGHVRPCVKPDFDNTLKLIDALNGIVFVDDKQVVDARVKKIYTETPGLTIEIKTIGPPAPSCGAVRPPISDGTPLFASVVA